MGRDYAGGAGLSSVLGNSRLGLAGLLRAEATGEEKDSLVGVHAGRIM